MKNFQKLGVLGVAVALLGSLSGCVREAADTGEELTTGGGYGAPATVRLSGVVVGAVGTGILLENHSNELLEQVEIVINEESSGGFRYRAGSIPPNSTQTYLSQVFRTSAGESLNIMQTKATNFAVYANTPRGRGSWSGGYENQQ